ncbi:MAG: helix-turn-helix transcriptional regulator [archaeon]
MQVLLKQNLLRMTKEKGLSISKLERDAGLHKNFINNFLYDKSKNPGIESIIKIANVLDASIDELIGKEPEHQLYNLEITRKDIFLEVANYLLKFIQTEQNTKISLEQFFNAVSQIYAYSLKKDMFDKEFADWFINSKS